MTYDAPTFRIVLMVGTKGGGHDDLTLPRSSKARKRDTGSHQPPTCFSRASVKQGQGRVSLALLYPSILSFTMPGATSRELHGPE